MVATLPTFRDGVAAAAADLNALVANVNNLYAVAAGGKTGAKPALVLRVTGTHAVANNTDTTVTWDTADVNNDAMWSSGSTVTIQTAGTWRVTASCGTDGGAFGDGTAVAITINGTSTSANSVAFSHDASSTRERATATITATVGTTVSAVVNQKSGASRNLATSLGGCRFEFTYVGNV